MRTRDKSESSEQSQLQVFRALPGELAARDSQDLMAYPFFSLAKSKRTAPINFTSKDVSISVKGNTELGIATIWDADVLIWAASQIIEARDQGIEPSRLMVATPYEILKFIGRTTSLRDYDRLRAALARLQSTVISTSIRQVAGRRAHQFSWLNEWKERSDSHGRPLGISMILPDWFYNGLMDSSLVLTLDPVYFTLGGGIERWLYRLVRKHAGRQPRGWQFDFAHLHAKSGSLMRRGNFCVHLRRIAAQQSLPGFHLEVSRDSRGREVLQFRRCDRSGLRQSISLLAKSLRIGDKL